MKRTETAMQRLGRARRGFTLVEILATLAMVGIVMPSVMNGISLSLAAAEHARQQAQAAQLAHGKLSEIVATDLLQQTDMSGDFGTDWPDYRWEAHISDWDGATLRQLDVTVYWKRAGVERGVTMMTLIPAGVTI